MRFLLQTGLSDVSLSGPYTSSAPAITVCAADLRRLPPFSRCSIFISVGGPLDEKRSGFPSFNGIARLTWLIDLFGDLTVTSATREEQKEKDYSRMTAHFETADKK